MVDFIAQYSAGAVGHGERIAHLYNLFFARWCASISNFGLYLLGCKEIVCRGVLDRKAETSAIHIPCYQRLCMSYNLY